MKRTDLAEGMEVYWAERNTYEEAAWGRQGKATVLLVAAHNLATRYEAPRFAPLEPDHPAYSKSLVLVHAEGEGRILVPLNQLRGPYAQTWQRIQGVRARIAQHQQDTKTRDNQRRERSVHLAARLRDLLGLAHPTTPTDTRSGIDDTGRYGDGRHVTLTLDAAQQIADRLAHLEAQVGELTDDLTRERLAHRSLARDIQEQAREQV